MMHGQQNVKFCDAKEATQTYKYKNIKTKLYKNNAAIWYNKTCRLINKYIERNLCVKLDNYQESLHDAGQQNVKCVF